MVVRSLFEVKQQLCALVPGWVTATVRVVLLVDCSDTARSLTLGNNAACTCTSMRRSTPDKTCLSKTYPQFRMYNCTWLLLVTISRRIFKERSKVIIQDPRNIAHFFQVWLLQVMVIDQDHSWPSRKIHAIFAWLFIQWFLQLSL